MIAGRRPHVRRRGVVVALAIAAVVMAALAVTAWGTSPAWSPDANPGTFVAPLGDGEISVAVEPATVGVNDVHVYVTDAAGQLRKASDATVTMTSGSDRRAFALTTAGPGHLLAMQRRLPAAGVYDIVVTTTLGDAPQQATGTITVAEQGGLPQRIAAWCTLRLSRARR